MNVGLHDAKNIALKRVRVGIVFRPNGTSAPVVAAQPGLTSVTRTAVGLFTIQLSNNWVALDSWAVTPMLNAAADTQVELVSETVTSGLVYIRIKTAGSNADVAAHADNRVSVSLWLKATTVEK